MSKTYMSKDEKGFKLITTDGKLAHLTTHDAEEITHTRLDLIHEDETPTRIYIDTVSASSLNCINLEPEKDEEIEEVENEYRVMYEEDEGVVYQDVKATQMELKDFIDECNGAYKDFVMLGDTVFKKSRLVTVTKLK